MRATVLIALFASVLSAQTAPKPDPAIGLTPDAMVWIDGPPTLPPGSKMAVLEGSPKADGMFTMRVRIPAGSAIPPHWHPRQERVTILSGAVDLGFGSVANAGNTKRYRAGSFYVNPPRVMHFLFFPEATEMQMTGVGPWELLTTDLNAPAEVPTATVTVRSIAPLPGSELTPSMTINAVVDYDIRGFKPFTYFLDFVFETTTPNKTISVKREVKAVGDGPLSPPRPDYLQAATGTITLTQDLSRLLSLPDLKHPIRMRVFVHEQKSEMSSRVVGMSDWIAFK
ncbi:MAG TPA: cupin domain-containing protein [Thermoanaerobaculia bacterium]|jgi:quercetin dioxygenase-like cupin family protein|nr:cupin domain-containing protein [Thermoanaerobaculia bacterium]